MELATLQELHRCMTLLFTSLREWLLRQNHVGHLNDLGEMKLVATVSVSPPSFTVHCLCL
jgi:hypothetical protein